ncbi:MAG: response regulator transcription factor [Melioribacteraceae bacterium]|jgi:DNA-binding NarL/FixJ family response regulator|nr:response regulator transcription factor [Melioribacteraceae bacterium]RJP58357.1 MAG: DNA-binding response regulator [Ignavibacteriales bacterium]WKZ68791.1 MAG: response regulator transcription factor [Melioribacteraceae bacterium]
MKSIAIIEDDIELRELLYRYLSHQKEFKCTISVNSMEDFFTELSDENKPEIILSDIGLPGKQGDESLRAIKEKLPETEIVMLTVHDDPEKIFKCLQGGASGYLLKNSPLEEIKKYLTILADGGSPMSPRIARKVIEYFQPKQKLEKQLTEREYDIVVGLVEGLSYKMIADKYHISIDTVRQHIRSVYRKLNVNSKAEVITKKLRGEI